MTVTKINGFDAPYRSQTFQNQAQSIVQARGVLKMDGEIVTIGGDVQIPPFEVIQNGLIIRETASRTRPAPDQSAPYYLAVSAATPAAEVDDLSFSFPRSPDDISTGQVLLGYWDGIEWRKPQILSLAAIYNDIDQANIDFGRIGPRNGLLTSLVGPNYVTSAGVLVDRQGLRQNLEEDFVTPVLANDVDFDRVDRIVYRRPDDDTNRIGVRKFLVGGAHAITPTGVKETEFLPNTAVTGLQRVLFASTNSAVIITGKGYAESQQIWFTRYSSDRTTEEVAPTMLVGSLDTQTFDAVIDELNNVHVLYVNNGNLYYLKADYSGTVTISPTAVFTSTYVVSAVSAFYHLDSGNVFAATQVLIAPSNNKIYLQVVNGSSGILAVPVPSKQITHMNGNLAAPSIFVTDDYVVYVACEDLATGRVAYAKYNDSGDVIDAYEVVSASTVQIGNPTPLVNAAKQAQIIVADNKQLFVIFRQEYSSFLYGITVWTEGVAYMQELLGAGETFSNFKACIGSVINGINLLLVTATDTQYVKLEGQTVQFTYQVATTPADSISFCSDKYGALLHVWSLPNAGTFASYYNVGITAIGEALSINGGYAVIALAEDELLVPVGGQVPVLGDTVTISGSTAGNDGAYNVLSATIIDFSGPVSHYRVVTDGTFNTDYPGTGTADFQDPDGNAAKFVKTNAELTSLAYRLNVPSTDILLARCSLPGPVILNYGDSAVGPTPTETARLLLYGDGTVVDWEQTLAGAVTLSGPGLHIADLVNNVAFDIANGTYALVEDQALFVVLDPLTTAVTPQVTAIATLDWSLPIQVLGIIKEGNFAPHALLTGIGFEELEPGEANIVGESLPDIIRTRLGILSDTQFQPYTSHNVFFPEDDYAIAISNLDAVIYGFHSDVGDIEINTVTNPAGVTSYTATKFTWSGDHDRTDIQVYINGKHLTQSLDGSLGYDWHKGDVDRIEFHFTVPYLAEIVIRKERTGGGYAGFLKTYYEGSLVQTLTQKLNFTGAGCSASNGGTGQTNIHIPGGPAFGYACIKSYQNKSGGVLSAGTAVAFDDDGGLVLSDANVSTIADFAGIVIADFSSSNYGDVFKLGNCPGVLSGLGAMPGQLVYLGETPGTLSLSPPVGLNDTIMIVGRAEPANATLPDGTAIDLYLNPQLISGV